MQLINDYLEKRSLVNGLSVMRSEFLDKPVEVVVQTKRTELYNPTRFKFRGKLYALIYSPGYTHLKEREIYVHDVLSEDFEIFWNYKANHLLENFTCDKDVAGIIGKRVFKTSENKTIPNLVTIGFQRQSHEIVSLKLEEVLIYQKPMKIL